MQSGAEGMRGGLQGVSEGLNNSRVARCGNQPDAQRRCPRKPPFELGTHGLKPRPLLAWITSQSLSFHICKVDQ